MARRSLEEDSIRKLTRVGQGSLAVTIPVAIIKTLGLQERQKVIVRREGKKIIIEDWENND